jgi:hypothetical protein
MNPASERDSQHIMYGNRLSDIQIAAMSELPAARQRLMEKHFA